MTDVLLGVIAAAVLVMAAIQVAAVVIAARVVRQVGDVCARIERDVRPIVENLQACSLELARATTTAAAQVDRAGRLIGDLSDRLDDAIAGVQRALAAPARRGMSLLQALKAAFAGVRDGSRGAGARATVDDEDPLFIG